VAERRLHVDEELLLAVMGLVAVDADMTDEVLVAEELIRRERVAVDEDVRGEGLVSEVSIRRK